MDIFKILSTSFSMYNKSINLEYEQIVYCLAHTLAVLMNDTFFILAGSTGEGTNITPSDYHRSIRQSVPFIFFSDIDVMSVMYLMRVMEEGEKLPQRFDNYIYCRAERGKHTTDGFRKLSIIHNPECYSASEDTTWMWAEMINRSIEDGYISSERFMALFTSHKYSAAWKHTSIKSKNCEYKLNK